MASNTNVVPELTTVQGGNLYPLESVILNHATAIESWFRARWEETPALITSSVDLRHSGFKLAPVDTNLFPAGFNNLSNDMLSWCARAAKSVMQDNFLSCNNMLLLPENHTRNKHYLESICVLRDIFMNSGFNIRIGSLAANTQVTEWVIDSGDKLVIEPLLRHGHRLMLDDFDPCFILLNNDLSSGIMDCLYDLEQQIQPPIQLGWCSRLKSDHFQCFADVVHEFSTMFNIDAWLLSSIFTSLSDIDFMTHEGIERMVISVDKIIAAIRDKYATYEILEKPFVVVKADNGTYGMSVMMVTDGAQLRHLNRKQRTRMSATKGGCAMHKVIIQEGVYSVERTTEGFVAEPVIYMIGKFVVGGFYRVHASRKADENLNAPGMHFEPIGNRQKNEPNRFYAYSVIARLAALAAAREVP